MKKLIQRIRARFRRWAKRERAEVEQRIEVRHDHVQERIDRIRAKRKPFRMFDSIEVDEIPADAKAVAGYVNGMWATWEEVKRRFPHAKKLSIAVTSSADADCLDVEPGDATPADAPAWVKRQQARGVERPVVYCSLSTVSAVLGALARAGIKRSQVRLWTAHYTHEPHLCDPSCGFGLGTTADATQFTDRSGGRSLDESLCAPDFL